MRRVIIPLALAATSVLFAAGSASAATQQQGLVNVSITDVTVQAPISVALNVCDVTVAVLTNTLTEGPTSCTAQGGSIALVPASGGGSSTSQNGLVNVNLSDID